MRAKSVLPQDTSRDQQNEGQSAPFAAGALVRVHVLHPSSGFPFVVTVDATGRDVGLQGMVSPRHLGAFLTHEEGISWPNRQGEAMARATLARGGVVAMCFESLADSMACRERIAAEASR